MKDIILIGFSQPEAFNAFCHLAKSVGRHPELYPGLKTDRAKLTVDTDHAHVKCLNAGAWGQLRGYRADLTVPLYPSIERPGAEDVPHTMEQVKKMLRGEG